MKTVFWDGKVAADCVRSRVRSEVETLLQKGNKAPVLAVLEVGNEEASAIYLAQKEKACAECGIGFKLIHLPKSVTQSELTNTVTMLNKDKSINGILIQLPLPEHINVLEVLEKVAPEKDVDGLTSGNLGSLWSGNTSAFASCTAAGIMELFRQNHIELSGKHVVICSRSRLIGKPLAALMLQENATVTFCHSHTDQLKDLTVKADILIAAVGHPNFFDSAYIKEGAIVIDAGIHRTENGIVGDVNTQDLIGKASAITPVPGGVGPMTVALLTENCMKAYLLQNNGE